LGTNAAHAMREKGGTLSMSLVEEDLDSGTAVQDNDLNPGPYLKLTVCDTGSGIDDKTIKRVFEPYFITKGTGEGTGMGLALIHGIVKSHGGTITVESKLGEGTIFNIYLPRIEVGESPVEMPSDQLPRGTERILFVDDEKGMADVVQPMLETLGYNVTARTSSIEALEAFKNNPQEFDLVITDMTMPNMTGKDLAKELMSIQPDVPIILCTGLSEQIDEVQAKEMGISFMMKPIVLNQMANMIREMLDK
ncbi:response regulator, partial [Thermodesulfobacteriota bacterium]